MPGHQGRAPLTLLGSHTLAKRRSPAGTGGSCSRSTNAPLSREGTGWREGVTEIETVLSKRMFTITPREQPPTAADSHGRMVWEKNNVVIGADRTGIARMHATSSNASTVSLQASESRKEETAHSVAASGHCEWNLAWEGRPTQDLSTVPAHTWHTSSVASGIVCRVAQETWAVCTCVLCCMITPGLGRIHRVSMHHSRRPGPRVFVTRDLSQIRALTACLSLTPAA